MDAEGDSSVLHERVIRIESSVASVSETLRTLNARMEVIGDLALSIARLQERLDTTGEGVSTLSGRVTAIESEFPLLREKFSTWAGVYRGAIMAVAAASVIGGWFITRLISDYDSQLNAYREQYTTIDRRLAWAEYSIRKPADEPVAKGPLSK